MEMVGDIKSIFFFQADDGMRDVAVTGVQPCALPIYFFAAPDGSIRSWMNRASLYTPRSRTAAVRPSFLLRPARAGIRCALRLAPVLLTVRRSEIGRARVGKECRSRWSPYH